MKKIKYLFFGLFILLCVNIFAQDFHMANIKVGYEQGNKVLNITARAFTDQLEKTLGVNASNKSVFESKLKSYVENNLKVKINGKELGTSYYDYQLDDKFMKILFKFDGISDISSIELNVSLLTDAYPDQQNVVTFDYKDKKNTSFLTKDNTVVNLKF